MAAPGEGTAGMRQWGNSRELTKVSYGLIQANPGMTRWTTRAVVHAAIVGGIGVVIGLVVLFGGIAVMDSTKDDSIGAASLALFVVGGLVTVLGLIAGLTAANLQFAGLISATDDVLHGRPVDEQAAKAKAKAKPVAKPKPPAPVPAQMVTTAPPKPPAASKGVPLRPDPVPTGSIPERSRR